MTTSDLNTIRELYHEGYCTKEIASIVDVSKETVNYHLRKVKGKLSLSERLILVHMANGLSAKDISQETGLTVANVERYKVRMLRKLNCRNSCQVIAWGFKNKYLI